MAAVEQKITPTIWCAGTAAEAGEFYAATFPRAHSRITGRYPSEGLPEFQQDLAGAVLTVDVDIDGFGITLINAGDQYAPTEAISLMVNFSSQRFGSEESAFAELDALWARLLDGGAALMELGEYPFSRRYGWVRDRFGMTWQLIFAEPDGDTSPFVMPSLLFGGRSQNKARAAVELYTSLFSAAAAGTVIAYDEAVGPAAPGSVMYTDFTIENQWFAAMDAAAGDAEFTPGVSLMVACDDQDEIDRLWDALSSVPDAEQCGWLVDPFGVSWQIVPARLGELLSKPGAYQRMLQMKRIVIADL